MKNRNLIFGLTGIALIAMAFTHGLYESALAVALVLLTLIVFYGIRSFAENPIDTIFFMLVVFISLSFVKWFQVPVTYALAAASLMAIVVKRQAFVKAIATDWEIFKDIAAGDCISWFLAALFIISYGFMTVKGFFTLDLLHPTYELSIGQSYDRSLILTPDLSYIGKGMRYHFLSTPLPIYFSHVLNVSVLSAAYFFVPLFLLILIFLTVYFFFNEFPTVRLPVFLLFFTPLFAFNIFDLEGLLQRMVSTNSHLLGFLFVILCSYYLAKERRSLFLAAAVMLILIKASFFLVILGGVALFYLRTKEILKLFFILTVLLPVFVLLNFLFLSGAHQHNAWIIFPTVIYWGQWMMFLPLIFLVAAGVVYFFNTEDKALLALSSATLAGMLGALLLTEVTEANSIQFLVGAYFATVLVFWHFLARSQFTGKKFFTFFISGLIILGFVTSLVRIYREPLKDFAAQNIPRGLLRKLPSKMASKIQAYRLKPKAYISKDFIEAYTWLGQHSPENSVVLFGKHYEVFTPTKNWWPETGFIRSALSGRQMYCENYKYKSIGMETEFAWRFANTINFYNQFVAPAALSREIISDMYGPGFSLVVLPKKEATSGLGKYLNPAKARRWPDRTVEIDSQFKTYLHTLPKTKEWGFEFIETAKINYIVLENGDRPAAFLEQITQQVYANKTVSIYKVTPKNLWNL